MVRSTSPCNSADGVAIARSACAVVSCAPAAPAAANASAMLRAFVSLRSVRLSGCTRWQLARERDGREHHRACMVPDGVQAWHRHPKW